MAHVRKARNGGGWECRWSYDEPDPTRPGETRRKFQSERFRTKAAAEAKEREIADRKAKGMTVDHSAGKRTVESWANEWHRYYASRVGTHSIKKSRGLLDASVIPLLGRLAIREVTPATVADWIQEIKVNREGRGGRPISPTTIRHHYLVLRNVLQYAAENGAIHSNPANGVRLPTNKSESRPEPQRTGLTIEQVATLADQFPYPYDLLIEFLAYTGLRVGECSGLNVGDVDLDNCKVRVERTRTKRACTARCGLPTCQPHKKRGNRFGRCLDCVAACNSRECCWEIGTPKSGKARTTTLPASLVPDLRDYLAKHEYREDPEAPFWPGRTITARIGGNQSALDYSKPWNPGPFYRGVFKPIVRRTPGIPDTLRQHDLRHTFASICDSNGVKASQVAAWMGHSNEIVTRTIYMHLFGEDTTAAEAAMDQAFTKGRRSRRVVPISKGA